MNISLLSQLVAATVNNSFMYLAPADSDPFKTAGFAEVNGGMPNPNGDGSLATRATQAGIDFVNQQNAQAQTQQPVTDFSGAAPVTGFGNAPAQTQPTFQGNAPAGGQAPVQPTQTQATGGIAAGVVRVSGFQPVDKPKGVRSTNPGEGEKYPFSTLNAPVTNPDGTKSYDAFFVPSNTHTKGDKAGQLRTGDEMAFSLQSACNAATRRFAEVAGTVQRKDNKTGQMKNVNNYKYTRKFAVQGSEQNGVVGAMIYREL